MTLIQDVCDYLETFAPAELAEEWDNVGLLAGDPTRRVKRVMTCLTITAATVEEAVAGKADLIVTHHPLPFRPLKRIVATTAPGRLLWDLLTHAVAIYSPHTAFDSAPRGINQRLAEGLGLEQIAPLVPMQSVGEPAGSGRMGRFPEPMSLHKVADRLGAFLGIRQLQHVGQLDVQIQQVAVACGAAGAFLGAASQADCDLLVLGETNLHTCLEAEALGVSLLLPGHHASERFAVEQLAPELAAVFPTLEVWASARESDPLRWSGR